MLKDLLAVLAAVFALLFGTETIFQITWKMGPLMALALDSARCLGHTQSVGHTIGLLLWFGTAALSVLCLAMASQTDGPSIRFPHRN
jgi:hypothetical protein